MGTLTFEDKKLFNNAIKNTEETFANPKRFAYVFRFWCVLDACGFERILLNREFHGVTLTDFSYVVEYPFGVSGKEKYVFDVAVFTRHRQALYVELDGDSHKKETQKKRDLRKERAANLRGRRVLHIWDYEIMYMSPSEIWQKVFDCLRLDDPYFTLESAPDFSCVPDFYDAPAYILKCYGDYGDSDV
jgi:hypothetical protein